MTAVGIVGPGRAGVGLGLALSRAGHRVYVHGEHAKVLPVALELTWGDHPPWLGAVEVVLLAVPDAVIPGLGRELAKLNKITDAHTVLHLSGVMDKGVLAPLKSTGAALGSLHPLQSLRDPETAPDRIKGAFAAVEGDDHAIEMATSLARTIGLRPIVIPSDKKPLYHAAAVIASNYLVVIAAVAERLMQEVGLSEQEAREGLGMLLAGTAANVRAMGPAALTGPVVRGDAETVRRNLEVLPADVRDMYRALGRVALGLVDLPAEKRAAVEKVLDESQ